MKHLYTIVFIASSVFLQAQEWESISPTSGLDWDEIHCSANGDLYVIGNQFFGTLEHGMFRSQDSGASWTKVYEPADAFFLRAITETESGKLFLGVRDANNYRALIYSSADQFASQNIEMENDSNDGVFQMAFSGTTGYAVGYDCAPGNICNASEPNGIAYRSVDDGDTWTELPMLPVDGAANLQVIDEQTLFVADRTALELIWSKDGGQTWTQIDVPDSRTLVSFYVMPDTSVLIGTVSGRLYRVQPDGSSDLVHTVSGNAISRIQVKGAYGLAVTDKGRALISLDSGSTWTDELVLQDGFFLHCQITPYGFIAAGWEDQLFIKRMDLTPEPPTGILDPGQELFSVYPNPTNDHVCIEYSMEGGYRFQLFNVMGECVQSKNMIMASKEYLNIPGPAGCYTLQIIDSSGERSHYPIIKR